MSSAARRSAASAGAELPEWSHLDPAVRRTGSTAAPASRPQHSSQVSAPWDGAAEDPDGSHQGRRRDRLGVLGVLTRILVAAAVPLFLLAAGVRLVATPLFLWVEYHRPGFPVDAYGLSSEDRMTLGSHGMDYILNWAPGDFLGSVRTPSGRSWFTPGEVEHMTDVKLVLQIGLWAAVLVVVLALVLALIRRRDRDGLLGAVAVGGWLTVIAAIVLAVVAVLGWQQFFAAFHGLFFSEGTWTFRSTDTLIRLYPTAFWMDAAIVIAVLTIGGAVLAAVLAQRARRRR